MFVYTTLIFIVASCALAYKNLKMLNAKDCTAVPTCVVIRYD